MPYKRGVSQQDTLLHNQPRNDENQKISISAQTTFRVAGDGEEDRAQILPTDAAGRLLSLGMNASTVIVEPDSVEAWLGLIGVVAGVVITTATNWLQDGRHDRVERQHELDEATGQVIASATSVVTIIQLSRAAKSASSASGRSNQGTESEWADKITRAIERLQLADQVIQRYGQGDVAETSSRIVSEAIGFARGRVEFEAVDDAIASFTRVLHK